MARIILTGAHGTGKTTVLNLFKSKGFNTITEVVRELHKRKGIAINEAGNSTSQLEIFNAYSDLLSNRSDYISDRGLTDVMAYTTWAYKSGNVDRHTWLALMERLVRFIRYNDDVLYIYFPVEFGLENDGTRSVDKKFQKDIDGLIRKLLEQFNIPFVEVHGTPEERVRQIEGAIAHQNHE